MSIPIWTRATGISRFAGRAARVTLWALLMAIGNGGGVRAADAVYSGPQPGEKTTGFRVVEVSGPSAGQERDPVAEIRGAPAVLVFVHAIERSLVPLLRVIDEYAATWRETLRGEIVFLAADRLSGLERVKAATGSLQLKTRSGLALGGAEGPGNYGLHRDCLMTIVAARDNRVVTNFALVQPGIADGARVLAALATLTGDTNPPTSEVLAARMAARGGGMRRDAGMSPRGTGADSPKDPFPGAVPTDPTLNRLLRLSIRPTNDVAAVDRTIREMEAHARGSADLTRQTVEGWTRVLHFGDRYGTEHARREGRALVERLSRPQAKE